MVDVRAGGERDVLAVQGDQFADPQPGLDRQREHGVIASADPGALVRGCEQRVDFGFGEVGDRDASGALVRDREHAPDRGGVLGVLQRQVAKQRVDRGETVVAGRGGVAAIVLEVVKERCDQGRVQLRDVELARRCAQAVCGEFQQQPEAVAVSGDRVRAGGALTDETVDEERLQAWGQRGHGRAPKRSSRRWAASAISSGVAVKYQ
jgi:hypothetical protein